MQGVCNIIEAMKANGKSGKRAFTPRLKRAGAALLFALSLALCACTGAAKPAKTELFAMDTYISLTAYGEGAKEALSAVSDDIKELDRLLSATDEGSDIYAINNSSGEPVSVSPLTMEALSASLRLSKRFNNALALSLYPVTLAWGFTTGENRVPTDDEIASLLPLVNDNGITLDEMRLTVIADEGMMLDLGAFAKGFACGRAAEILADAGVSSALLDMGSSTIAAIGLKPDGTKWRVALRDPQSPDSYAGIIEAEGVFISTSGGFERYFTAEDGTKYGHVLDPETGRPAESGVLSVTVLTDNALYGDALSTALFVMGADAAEGLRREARDFEFIIVTGDGLLVSQGAAELFTPAEGYGGEKMRVIGCEE